MSAILNTGALAGKVVFVTGASRGIGSDMYFRVVARNLWTRDFLLTFFMVLGSDRNFEFFDSTAFHRAKMLVYHF